MKTINTLLLFCFVAMVACSKSNHDSDKAFSCADEMVAQARMGLSEISVQEFHQLMEGEEPYVLIDVRLKEEHDKGFIPGSVLIPRGVLEFRIDNEKVWDEEGLYVPEKEDLLILYCKMSNRSPLAAQQLRQLGYNNVKVIGGGWLEWTKAYPEIFENNIEEGASQAMVSQEESSGGC